MTTQKDNKHTQKMSKNTPKYSKATPKKCERAGCETAEREWFRRFQKVLQKIRVSEGEPRRKK